MKIHEWLNDSMSAINGIAVIELEPGETADAEQMLALVDSAPGFFGYSIDLVSTGEAPKVHYRKGWKDVDSQFGFPHMPTLQQRRRYYKVFVNRD